MSFQIIPTATFIVVYSFAAFAFSQTPTLPKNVSVTVTKQGDKPASIFIVSSKEKVRFVEGEWDKIPEEARPYVSFLFGLKKMPLLQVTLDCSGAPEAEKWAENAAKVAETQFPILVELLESDGFEPVREVKIVFKKMDGVAYASGTTITISADWIAKHPDDIGMVVHELVHVVQAYRHRVPGWVTEGIADYIRFFLYEKNGDRTCRVNPERSKYTDSYRTTGAFFDWIVRNRNPRFVTSLNAICRSSGLPDDRISAVFQELAGDEPDKLWAEFVESLKKRKD